MSTADRRISDIQADPDALSMLAMGDHQEYMFGLLILLRKWPAVSTASPIRKRAVYGYRDGKMVQFAKRFWFHSA